MAERFISFCNRCVRIQFENDEVAPLIQFLFDTLIVSYADEVDATFCIHQIPANNQWQVERDGKLLLQSENMNEIANFLSGEVLFSLIKNLSTGMAIHAGLVSKGEKSILLPAESGSGKSSVTIWFLSQGWRYHTDELVVMEQGTNTVQAFTRPINIKSAGLDAVRDIIDLDICQQHIKQSTSITLIPHQLIDSNNPAPIPPVSTIIFPKYDHLQPSHLKPISGAEAGLQIMQSNVIARNLPQHGFTDAVKLVKNIPSYQLQYQHFDHLKSLVRSINL